MIEVKFGTGARRVGDGRYNMLQVGLGLSTGI